MKIRIDREGCIGCGLCVSVCPDVFRLAEDGLAEVYAEPQKTDPGTVHEAAGGCPVGVIHVE